MKSIDICFTGNPDNNATRLDGIKEAETDNYLDLGEWVKREFDGLPCLRISIEQPWLLVSEIDLTDPVAHPLIFIVRAYAINGEYHVSLESKAVVGEPDFYWRDSRNNTAYPLNYFKYYQPIEGPPHESN